MSISVLLLDDDADLNDTLCQALLFEGYDARCAFTLEAAREVTRTIKPVVAVIDWKLDGGETSEPLLEELANDPTAPGTVLMSAHPKAKEIADRFGIPLLVKPFDLDALFEAVNGNTTSPRRPKRAC